MEELFYRDENAVILAADCCGFEKILEATMIYPIGSNLSCAYQHIDGIVLTVDDAEKIGIKKEA